MPHKTRFWAKVDKAGPGGCWLWTAAIDTHGYGAFRLEGRTVKAHRLAVELERGPIPDGLVIDHLCRVRHCVNPGHLEPVTNRENILRGVSPPASNARRDTCDQGHELEVSAWTGKRACPECVKARRRAWRAANRDRINARRREQRHNPA